MLFLFFALVVFQDSDLQEYCNDRFGFCASYPKVFTGQGEAENGDGQVFLANDKQAEIRAYGMLVVEGVNENIQDEFDMGVENLQVSYKVVKPDWFVVSGLNKDGRIVYRKTVKRKIRYQPGDEATTLVYQTLMITYPKSQQAQYGSYCKVIAKAFQ
jgi:hypothetical protein